jgi:hypothetical protein
MTVASGRVTARFKTSLECAAAAACGSILRQGAGPALIATRWRQPWSTRNSPKSATTRTVVVRAGVETQGTIASHTRQQEAGSGKAFRGLDIVGLL